MIGDMVRCEDGQGLVEYGLILALISVAAVAAIVLIGPKVRKLYVDADAKVSQASGGG